MEIKPINIDGYSQSDRANEEIRLLHRINLASNCGEPVDEVLKKAANGIREVFGFSACNIFMLDDTGDHLTLIELAMESSVLRKVESVTGFIARGHRVQLFEGSRFTRCVRDLETVYSEDLQQMFGDCFRDKSLRRFAAVAAKIAGFRSVVCVPLIVEGKGIGVIGVASKNAISEKDIDSLKRFSIQLSLTIGKVIAEKDLKESEERLRLLSDAAQEGICIHDKGTLLDANNKLIEMMGYDSLEELVGINVLEMVSENSRDKVLANIKKEYEEPYEVELSRKDGSTFPVIIKGRKYPIKGKVTRVVTITDISFQKEAENRMKASLKEKEVLLREVHHRVKNNMAIIASMLSMQMSQTASQESLGLLMSSFNRIRAMSLVHELLYSSDELSEIKLKQYIKTLAINIVSSLRGETGKIDLRTNVEQVSLDLSKLIPVGLILNEAITNSVKHAFHEIEKPRISITVAKDEAHFTMVIEDNGFGIREEDFNQSKSLGGKIMEALVGQLMGEFNMSSGKKGTKIEIKCPIAEA